MRHRLSVNEAPYVDFAMFGPYGTRTAKKRRFVTQIFLGGEMVSKQLKGPQSLEEWLASWKVFRPAMLMLGECSPSTLDIY